MQFSGLVYNEDHGFESYDSCQLSWDNIITLRILTPLLSGWFLAGCGGTDGTSDQLYLWVAWHTIGILKLMMLITKALEKQTLSVGKAR